VSKEDEYFKAFSKRLEDSILNDAANAYYDFVIKHPKAKEITNAKEEKGRSKDEGVEG